MKKTQINFKDICTMSYGAVSSSVNFNNIERYIRITDINSYGRLKEKTKVSPRTTDEKYLVSSNDLLIIRLGNRTGESYINRDNKYIYIFASYIIRCKISKKSFPLFIYYSTMTTRFKDFIQNILKVSNKKSINIKELGMYNLYLPSYYNQVLIAKKLTILENSLYTQSKLL